MVSIAKNGKIAHQEIMCRRYHPPRTTENVDHVRADFQGKINKTVHHGQIVAPDKEYRSMQAPL